jgi:hypothetical protein
MDGSTNIHGQDAATTKQSMRIGFQYYKREDYPTYTSTNNDVSVSTVLGY